MSGKTKQGGRKGKVLERPDEREWSGRTDNVLERPYERGSWKKREGEKIV